MRGWASQKGQRGSNVGGVSLDELLLGHLNMLY